MPLNNANDGTSVGTLSADINPGPNLVTTLHTSALSAGVTAGDELTLVNSANGQRKTVYAAANASTSATSITIAGTVFGWKFAASTTTIYDSGAQRIDPEGDTEVSANATAD